MASPSDEFFGRKPTMPTSWGNQGGGYGNGSGGGIGWGGWGAPTATATAPTGPKHGTEQEMWDLAGGIEDKENQRYQLGLDTLTNEYNQTKNSLSQLIDPDLLFSKAADSIGARAKGNMNALRSSLGARGLNPNSGAANGMLQRFQMQQTGDVIGATRDVAIENQRQRQVNAAMNFANALNLANFQNAPVSGAKLETSQNIFEGNIAREGIAAQSKSQKQASKDNKTGTIVGSLAGLAGGLI